MIVMPTLILVFSLAWVHLYISNEGTNIQVRKIRTIDPYLVEKLTEPLKAPRSFRKTVQVQENRPRPLYNL
jgi:hypothetical protein